MQSKHCRPFCLIKLTLPPHTVDVNISPTKREVAFLHHNAIAMHVASIVEEILLQSSARRLYEPRQAILPFVPSIAPIEGNVEAGTDLDAGNCLSQKMSQATTQRAKAGGDHKLIRVDARMAPGALEKFAVRTDTSMAAVEASVAAPRRRRDAKQVDINALGIDDSGRMLSESTHIFQRKPAVLTPGTLTSAKASNRIIRWTQDCFPMSVRPPHTQHSVRTLTNLSSAVLRDVMQDHVFIGMVDAAYASLQHQTKLYVVHLPSWTHDYIQRKVLMSVFSHPENGLYTSLDAVAIAEPTPSVEDLLRLALDAHSSPATTVESDADTNDQARMAAKTLYENTGVLANCYNIHIKDGQLVSLPLPLQDMALDVNRLPVFLLAVSRIQFSDLAHVHTEMARLIADLYSMNGSDMCFVQCDAENFGERETQRNNSGRDDPCVDRSQWIRHVLMEEMRWNHFPPRKRLEDATILELASLEGLFRVFERC